MQVEIIGDQKIITEGPLPGRVLESSGYGPRDPFTYTNPVTGIEYTTSAFHRASDMVAPVGTPIRTVAPGRVELFDDDPLDSAGLIVSILHDDGWRTHYFHTQDGVPRLPRNTPVASMQTIAFVGLTGLTTGPHLHYVVRKPDWTTIDPTGPEAVAWVNSWNEDTTIPEPEPCKLPLGVRAMFQAYNISYTPLSDFGNACRWTIIKPK